jgi:hypothetical protein
MSAKATRARKYPSDSIPAKNATNDVIPTNNENKNVECFGGVNFIRLFIN